MTSQDYQTAEASYLKLIEAVPDVGELYSNLGLARYFLGKRGPAEESFQKALTLNPGLFVAHYFLGRIYFEQSRYPQALPRLEAAWRAQPRHEVLRLLAGTFVALDRPNEAIARYQKLLSQDAKDVDAYYGLGLVYLNLARKMIDHLAQFPDSGFVSLVRAEHYADRPEWAAIAESSYRDAVERSPEAPGLRSRLGLFLIKRGETEQASAMFEQELKLDPLSGDARLGLAAIHLQKGELDAARLELDEAAASQPRFFQPLPPLPCSCELPGGVQSRLEQAANDGSFSAAYLLAQLAGQPRTWAETATTLLAAMEAKAAARPSPAKAVLARELFRSGQYQELVETVPGVPADNPEMLYLLGGAYKQLALTTLYRVAELDPESARSYTLVGDSLSAQGLFVEAAKAYEAAARLSPRDTELQLALGDAHLRAEEFEAAADTYGRVLAINPKHAQAYAMLGEAELRLNRPAAAIVSLGKALELNPDLVAAQAALGKALALADRPDEAIRYLEMAAPSDEDGSVHYRLSQLYRDRGDSEKARAALREFQRLRDEQKKNPLNLYRTETAP